MNGIIEYPKAASPELGDIIWDVVDKRIVGHSVVVDAHGTEANPWDVI